MLGPSGTGKTTFMNLLAGFVKPTKGIIEADRNNMGYVFQDPRLVPWLTVRENLKLVNEYFPEMNVLLKEMGLDEFTNYYPRQLSRGMQQRVNIIRALSIQPDTLLLDEAFSALDLPLKYRLMEYLFSVWNREKFTLILATHDLKEAIFLADRILLLTSLPSRIRIEYLVKRTSTLNCDSQAFLVQEKELMELIFHCQLNV